MKPIIIVGAGLAGYTVARELRKLDKLTPLVIVTADDGDFYSKPMLSNAFAQGKSSEQLVNQSAAQMEAQLNARILTGTRVRAIEAIQKTLYTDSQTLAYDKLVIAAGAQPIRLAIDGDAADQVLSVNHLSDYAVFRTRLALVASARPPRIAILGAGLIGCEFANDLASAGYTVSIIDPNPSPLSALAAPALSSGLRDALVSNGVALRLGTTATSVEHHADALLVTLADNTTLEVDIVLSAVGLRPDLTLAQSAQLKTNRGIVVDQFGATSAADVYALGDCAEYTTPGTGSTRTLPYIAPLMVAARAIARTLTGQPTAIALNPAPVIVKTPCYPLALMPPPQGVTGTWHDHAEGKHTICRYIDMQGVLHGFGVAPQEATVRQRLLAALGTTVEYATGPAIA
jgi:rubredoxin-NAD+ reductase